MNRDEDSVNYPLIGSIQNSVGMGFLGNQAVCAVAHPLGARVIHAPSTFSGAHGGFTGRATTTSEESQFRRDVAFLVSQRPGLVVVGFLPKPYHVAVVATQLRDYKGIVLLDPVIGDYKKGLYVSRETARLITEMLLPLAEIVTPNRFEAEVLMGGAGRGMSEFAYLNAIFDLGPKAVIIKSFERDLEKRRITSLFSNGYNYYRIGGPYFPQYQAHGAGDVFAAGVAALCTQGASPFAAAVLSTALSARAVANTTGYGGATVDPVAALEKWSPLGYHVEDDRAIRFGERSNVEVQVLKPSALDGARLKFAPPKHKIIYG
jgi:pyridoxine kinase